MSKRILLAEDNEFIQRSYVARLKAAGYEVDTAIDGNIVLELMEKNIPDIILLDLMMPNKNGFSTLGDIRANEAYKDIPVLVFSNLSQESDKEKVKELGANEFIVKSNVSMKDVIAKIEGYLK